MIQILLLAICGGLGAALPLLLFRSWLLWSLYDFSTFSLELFELLEKGLKRTAFTYGLATIIGTVFTLIIGFWMAE
ncbi:fluoride ion exporter CrcB/FEX [Geomicrobium halophilum]|uniref:Fluoride ion exporter CrcB/FEX n=1 Tax=Geomicrobium halophilum TaxID=549000 RepID=A0A841PI03_9BACL|nr:hypothetical protein [Geomicrobium halophilum]MBB6448420.1 fluoride ion exporter CrcB/FEX [Geomicrobium halophilum]